MTLEAWIHLIARRSPIQVGLTPLDEAVLVAVAMLGMTVALGGAGSRSVASMRLI
jgi:hypothetical protein